MFRLDETRGRSRGWRNGLSMRILIVDNYDSYTYNLFQSIAGVIGAEPVVVLNDAATWSEVQGESFEGIVLSPGPGRPENRLDLGLCREVIRRAKVPILGVCLGHQAIAHEFGGRIVHGEAPCHGRISSIRHDGSSLFAGIAQPFSAVRYHSLIVDHLPETLVATAWTGDGVIMGLRHRERPMWGVQFHPESICTGSGRRLLENFFALVGERGAVDLSEENRKPRTRSFFQGPRREVGSFKVRTRTLPLWIDPEAAYVGLFGGSEIGFWLDRGPSGGRFSFLGGGDSARVISFWSSGPRVEIREGGRTVTREESIFDTLERELARRRVPAGDLPFDFNGGFVGYFGYEAAKDPGTTLSPDSGDPPDAGFIQADRMVVLDHRDRVVILLETIDGDPSTEDESWFETVEARIRVLATLPLPGVELGTGLDPSVFVLERSYETYREDVDRCLREIVDGESYEICLTNRISTSRHGIEPLALYRHLRSLNPAPYAGFLRIGSLAVLSSSPECFLKVDRWGGVTSKPIKGTSRRGQDPLEDRALRHRLGSSPKDRAENLMIVDLLRNDLGRVCEVGSVRVPQLMAVESYATVHQLVSTVQGRLRAGFEVTDLVRAAFPGGSMTGAPKVRTMQILEELEKRPRGVYSGAMGYLGFSGAADLGIVIRTAVFSGEEISIGAGGAIVAQSDPDSEFDEMLLKAEVLLRAIVELRRGGFEPEDYHLLGVGGRDPICRSSGVP